MNIIDKIAEAIEQGWSFDRIDRELLPLIQKAQKETQETGACIGYWNQKTGAFYKPDQLSSAHQKLIEDGILRRCYINPPHRTWAGLTDEDIEKVCGFGEYTATSTRITFTHLSKAIEAKLKEKNT